MLLTFTFTVNQETQEAAFAGNITPQQALQMLQNVVINLGVAEAVKRAKDGGKEVKGGLLQNSKVPEVRVVHEKEG